MDPQQDADMIAATRAYHEAIAPLLGGYYSNIDFDQSQSVGNYGPAYERLRKIKAAVRPGQPVPA